MNEFQLIQLVNFIVVEKEMRQRTCCGCHIYQDLRKKKGYLLVEHL